jgi:hypothetical protein
MTKALIALSLLAAGCGSRCKEVATARDALTNRAPAANRSADIRVTVPFERADALLAEGLAAAPLTMALEAPGLGPIEIAIPEIAATVREVHLMAGAPGKIRFAIRVNVTEPTSEIATLEVVAEVEPKLVREGAVTSLVIGFGPENLLEIAPALGPEAKASLDGAVARWVPEKLKAKVPRLVLDAAASKLGKHLTGKAYEAVRGSLLKRLGELTRLNLKLPDVPVAKVELRSTETALIADLTTDLPVRAGLAPSADTASEVSVVLSGSTVAELANWAIDHNHAPQWYSRSLKPSPSGEFRPRFDYVAEDAGHPFKVYAFQERGGCSYFRVGVKASVTMDGDKLEVGALDRALEASAANAVVEVAAWVKYFLTGSIDRSKSLVAKTQLTVGGRTLETKVVGAALTRDELQFQLRFAAKAAPSADLRGEPRHDRRDRLAVSDQPARERRLVQDPTR